MKTKTITLIAVVALFNATAGAAAEPTKKNDARGQLNQANQSGRTFDGNRSSSGNSTLNQGDAVVAKPRPSSSQRTPQQAAQEYRNSGRANPAPQSVRRKAAEPPPPSSSQAPKKK